MTPGINGKGTTERCGGEFDAERDDNGTPCYISVAEQGSTKDE